ncbi:MAG: HEPN domain-containing protein [Planctomycetes bacterium]|nr:HEPN domain-containing protein [Planctomycetota bacterium]
MRDYLKSYKPASFLPFGLQIAWIWFTLLCMVDIVEQINYWQNGALEDLEAAKQLISGDKIRHSLFFAHLSLEKILKSHICKSTGKIAPKIHNLIRLAEVAGLSLPDDKIDFMAEMNEFNLEGRYPVPFLPPISIEEAKDYIQKTEEALQWFIKRL